MRLDSAAARAFRTDRGFALLIVLWMLVLIAFITLQVTATGRTEARIAGNLAANAAAEAAVDGAVFETIFNLNHPRPERRWMPDGALHEVQIGSSRITVRVDDEAGRINPNFASPALLEGLLRAVGTKRENAADLAQAITAWVGSARVARAPQDASAAPLESLEELGQVDGMTTQLLQALRPHLSLFSPAQLNPARADPVVVAAITFAEGGPPAGSAPALPGDATVETITARIQAIAHGPGDAEVTRTVVARVGPSNARGYTLLAWIDGLE